MPDPPAAPDRPDDLKARKAIVTEFFRAWSEGEFDRLEQLLDPDGEWWTLASRASRGNGVQLERNRSAWAEARDGIRFRVVTLTAEEDRVAAVVESVADFRVQGSYSNAYHFLFRIAGGRIAQTWVYYDTALANRVLRGEGGGVPMASHAHD
jgi:uncharacterized protein